MRLREPLCSPMGGPGPLAQSLPDATQRVGLRSNAQKYPCEVTLDAFSKKASWRGMSPRGVEGATRAVERQRDDWSCMANSTARIAAGLHRRGISPLRYEAFKVQCPRVSVHAWAQNLNTFFGDQSGKIVATIAAAHPLFGSPPKALGAHVRCQLGVEVGLLKTESARACKGWLRASVGADRAAVVLMVYGHVAMHYVGLVGIDRATDTSLSDRALLLETDGKLFAMDIDTLVASMDACGTGPCGAGIVGRFNGLRLSV